jgi:hypothetical protein
MKRWVSVSLLTMVLLLLTAWTAEADGRGRRHIHRPFVRSHVHFGSAWWRPYPYWWDYPRPYYVYSPPPVVVEQPSVYIQQQPSVPAPPPPPPPPAESYWYYCASAKAYYPNVGSCPEAWVKVPPR